MASVYQHSRGNTPYWIGVYRDEAGIIRHRSTRLTNHAEAVSLAEKWERMGQKVRRQVEKRGETKTPNAGLIMESFITAGQKLAEGTFSEHDGRLLVNQMLESMGKSVLNSMSAHDFLTNWVKSKEVARSMGTAKRYGHTINSFLKSLGSRAEDGLTSVTAQDIQAFRDTQLRQGKSATTANMVVKTLRIPFNSARKQGLILVNPAEAVDLMESQGAERETFTPEQIQTLLKIKNEEWKGMILLGACAGLRIGDAANLTWEAIDFDAGLLRYHPEKTTNRNKRKILEVILLPDLEDYLLNRKVDSSDPKAPIFPGLHGMPVGGKTGLSRQFMDIMDKAGIDKSAVVVKVKGSKGRGFNARTFHSLRHTFISLMANIGVSEELRMRLAGHTSEVHQRYTHIETKTMKKALKKFPAFTQSPRNRRGKPAG